MKKSLFSMFAVAAGLLLATSCSTKQEDVKTDGEATVTFVAQVPSGINHRAPQRTMEDAVTFSDGLKATELQYAVYEVSGDETTGETWTWIKSLGTENLTLTDLKATLTLNLVNGKKYAVAFWAAAPGSKVYYFDKEKITITANYDGVLSSNDELDAFYAVAKFTVNGASQQTVELYRPFAQLNIGTADLTASAELGHTVSQAAVKVAAYNTLNLKTEEVEGDAADVTFNLAALPKAAFPVTGNDYLAMNYLLMPKDKSTANVTISYDAAAGLDARTFNNVPLQRNFRTNIYGKLLTSATEFSIEVKPGFGGDEDVKVWDGATTKEPTEEEGVLVISTPEEWAYLCENTSTIPAGAHIVNKSIKLAADLDFGGHDLKSFLLGAGVTVDGDGHAIKNARLVGDKCNDHNQGTFHASLLCAPGMAAEYTNVTVKNLTVEGGSVYCPHEDYGLKNGKPDYKGHAAVIFASIDNSPVVTLKNVHVIGVDIYGIQPVAGLVGRAGSSTLTIDGCSVENCHLHNKSLAGESGYVATLVGRTDDATKVTITNTQSLNNTIEAYYSTSRGLNTINLVAATGIDITNVEHSGNTATITCVETSERAESLSD